MHWEMARCLGIALPLWGHHVSSSSHLLAFPACLNLRASISVLLDYEIDNLENSMPNVKRYQDVKNGIWNKKGARIYGIKWLRINEKPSECQIFHDHKLIKGSQNLGVLLLWHRLNRHATDCHQCKSQENYGRALNCCFSLIDLINSNARETA